MPILKRLGRIDQKNNEDVKFGHVVDDMLLKIPPQKKSAVKFMRLFSQRMSHRRQKNH